MSRARNILILATLLGLAFFLGLRDEESAPQVMQQDAPQEKLKETAQKDYPIIINQSEPQVPEQVPKQVTEKPKPQALPFSDVPSTVYATKPRSKGKTIANPLGTRESSESNKEVRQGKVDPMPPESFSRYLEHLESAQESP